MPEERIESVNEAKQVKTKEGGSVNLGRHQAQCAICRGQHRQEIEERWLRWSHTGQLARDYGISRDCVYRHMHAVDLFRKRQQNLKGFLEQIIERVDQTPFNGSGLLTAFKLYMKMTTREKVAEPEQSARPNKVLSGTAQQEERDGSKPDQHSEPTEATPGEGQAGGPEVQTPDPTQTVQ